MAVAACFPLPAAGRWRRTLCPRASGRAGEGPGRRVAGATRASHGRARRKGPMRPGRVGSVDLPRIAPFVVSRWHYTGAAKGCVRPLTLALTKEGDDATADRFSG